MWDDQVLLQKVHEFSASDIASRKEKGTVSAKILRDDLKNAFQYMNLSLKDAPIFAWMVLLHIHEELEDGEDWYKVTPLYVESNHRMVVPDIVNPVSRVGHAHETGSLGQRRS